MEETPIGDLDLAVSIDPITDTFPIVNDASDDTLRINRNVFLGITGSPLGTTDTQSVSNKTIGTTNTVTLLDTLFALRDNLDTTKQAQFQLSGITTATTRTYTLPNASSTLADISTAQTFTNKTLTSPTITGGSITNSTISVDSISEFTAANGVTIDGLNIKDGKLNTNNSVVTLNLTDTSVTPAKLQTGTGSGWAWQTWTPTWTNLTVGNGVVNYSKYIQTGKTVVAKYSLTLGTTSSIGSAPNFTVPVTAIADSAASGAIWGTLGYVDVSAGGTIYNGVVLYASTTTGDMFAMNSSGSYSSLTYFSSTIPVAYGTGDKLNFEITYEAA